MSLGVVIVLAGWQRINARSPWLTLFSHETPPKTEPGCSDAFSPILRAGRKLHVPEPFPPPGLHWLLPGSSSGGSCRAVTMPSRILLRAAGALPELHPPPVNHCMIYREFFCSI